MIVNLLRKGVIVQPRMSIKFVYDTGMFLFVDARKRVDWPKDQSVQNFDLTR
jgi:hypothetical protein